MRPPRYPYVPITRSPSRPWPGGRRLALHFALGLEDYAFGEGRTEDLLPGAPRPDYVNTAWRDYGNRVGGFRLIERFARLGLPLAILLNTGVYDAAPDLVAFARAHGCEMVAHGHRNSDTLAGRTPADEAAYLRAVADRIAREEGRPPAGWSSPWLAQTESTVDLLVETGFSYLLDLRMDDRPVWLPARAGRLLALPYALELNDSSTMIGRQADAEDFARMIVDEFDEMLEASRTTPLVMSVVVHSFISGAPFRLRALGRALDHIAARRDEVWIAHPGEIARLVAAEPDRAV